MDKTTKNDGKVISNIQVIKSLRGFTLLELLATLTVATIIIGIVFSVLITTMNSYKNISNNQFLQQQANLFLTQLRTIHQQHDTYTISYDRNEDIYTVEFGGGTQGLGNQNTHYEITINNCKLPPATSCEVTRGMTQLVVSLKVSNASHNETYKIDTGIYRIRQGIEQNEQS